MPADQVCQLSDEQCDRLDKILQSAALTREYLARCKECNLPVEAAIAENEAQVEQAATLKRVFRPDRA